MDNKVKEMKIKLEKYLEKAKNILLSCDKFLQSTERNNIINNNIDIKSLYYISEINKNNEKTKKFFNTPIKNIDISFNYIFNKLYFNEYYFNGIPIPKDIKIKKKENKIFITWDIDDIRIKNINKQLKYFVKFIKVNLNENEDTFTYTSYYNNFLLDEYDNNTLYEIKIRACLDEAYGDWSEIKKFKLDELECKESRVFNLKKNKNSNNIFQSGNIFQNVLNNNNEKENINNIFSKSIFMDEQ